MKREIQRHTLFLLVVMLLLSLVACGETGNQGSGADKEAAMAVLQDVPYFGDVRQCKMTAEQATAYAQLIADGIAGKLPMSDSQATLSRGLYDLDEKLRWDRPVWVGRYSHCFFRNRAMLCDFAGDGNPYILILDDDLIDNPRRGGPGQFSVYGWKNDAVTSLVSCDLLERVTVRFRVDRNTGVTSIYERGSSGEAYQCGSDYDFVQGDLKRMNDWDWDDSQMVMTHNGVVTSLSGKDFDATWEQWQRDEADPVQYDFEAIPAASKNACSLRDMVKLLNKYSAAMSGGTAEPIMIQDHSDTQLMAYAMINELNGKDRKDRVNKGDWFYGDDSHLTYARLWDMDKDGVKELILSYDDLQCVVYQWIDGALKAVIETPDDGYIEEAYLGFSQLSKRYVIDFCGDTDGTGNAYCFVNHTERVFHGEEYTHNGKPCSKTEYDAVVNNYQRIEPIHLLEEPDDSRIEQTVAELNAIIGGEIS